MTGSYDLFNMLWAVHDIPAGVDYDDSVFIEQFRNSHGNGEPPEAVIREKPNPHITRVYVGPIRNTGPMVDLLRGLKAARREELSDVDV